MLKVTDGPLPVLVRLEEVAFDSFSDGSIVPEPDVTYDVDVLLDA
jgi:hypothetical protein